MKKRMMRAAIIMLAAASTVVVAQNPAYAASVCGTGPTEWSNIYNRVGKNSSGQGYPVSLHGETVYLLSGATTANGKAEAYGLNIGDILSIDRSKLETSVTWPSTSYVASYLGGWDWCERRIDSTTLTVRAVTDKVEGFRNATRVCLRRNNALQCANTWFADQTL